MTIVDRKKFQKPLPKTVVCPEYSLPSHLTQKSFSNNPLSSSSRNGDSSRGNYSGNKHRNNDSSGKKLTGKEEAEERREEVRNLMLGMKDFNDSLEIGKSHRRTIQEKLTKLGAIASKPQKMPLKLKIELDKNKKRKEKKMLDEYKSSHVIDSSTSTMMKKFKIEKRMKGKKSKK
jgi:hypothetical protein